MVWWATRHIWLVMYKIEGEKRRRKKKVVFRPQNILSPTPLPSPGIPTLLPSPGIPTLQMNNNNNRKRVLLANCLRSEPVCYFLRPQLSVSDSMLIHRNQRAFYSWRLFINSRTNKNVKWCFPRRLFINSRTNKNVKWCFPKGLQPLTL